MNLPNKLTVARAVMVPLFLVFAMLPGIPLHYLWACIIFSLASLTDFFDGSIARKKDMVTSFGSFLDPLADKVLVIGALIFFVWAGLGGVVPVVLIIARDFAVSGVRMIAATNNGKVISANWHGKLKTVLQMVFIIAILLACQITESNPDWFAITVIASRIAVWLLAAFTVASGALYLVQNKSVFNTFK